MAVRHSTRPAPLRERFDAKWTPCPMSGCWLWLGSTLTGGYGHMRLGAPVRENVLAHRAAYELYVGPVPDGMLVCHKCDNRLCVNPAHLFVGTAADNMRDASKKNRTTQGERNSFAKLTLHDVIVIRKNSHMPQDELARMFGVSHGQVRRIITGKTWAWAIGVDSFG